jgi:uncharacterized protein (TIGR00369 family)
LKRYATSENFSAAALRGLTRIEEILGTYNAYVQPFEQRVRASFARQSLMATMRAQITTVSAGMVEIRMPFSDQLTQQDGFLHAGVITSILDSACGYVALSVAPDNAEVLSVEFKVNLLAPAVGESFVARAHVKRAGKTLTVCTADAFALNQGNEKLVATMQATMMNMIPAS